MRLYITARFKGDENKPDIEKLCAIARTAGFDDFCFIRDVEHYQRGVFQNPTELMLRAKDELLQCDALLIDVSDHPTGGRIIEAGMAFGCDKPVIIIAKNDIEIGVPMSGIAKEIIRYSTIDDLVLPLRTLRQKLA